MLTFGERIHIARRRLGKTQRELAGAAGVTPNTIARVEQGNLKRLAGDTVAKIAKALGTTTDYLLGLSDESGMESTKEELGELESADVA